MREKIIFALMEINTPKI